MIDLTHSVSLALDHLVCCYCFLHDLYICSYDYEIMQLPDTIGIPCVISNATAELDDHKDVVHVSPKMFVELA